MERSQSYTSFETSDSDSSNRYNKRNNYNLTRTNLNNINNNSNFNNYKSKFASTSSLNLRKALEMRQTHLQMQQHQQKQLQQQQQWLLLCQQRRQQQELLKQQQYQRLQHTQSSENINAPIFLSSLSGLQLLQKRRQQMLQRQNSTTSVDELDFPLTQHLNLNQHDDDDDNEDFNADDNVILRNTNESNHHSSNDYDDDENQLTLTANSNSQLTNPLQKKLFHFQRQRPLSEAAISYRANSPLATENLLNQSQSVASSPTTSSMSAVTTATTSTTERRRLQQYDQSLSFDSAISSTTTNTNSGATTTSSMPNVPSNTDNMSPLSARHPHFGKLKRDNSLHSDSSRYSSVDSLLEARKPNPEAILINLGFGPVVSEDILSRIPKRFLKPSQLRGIDTEAFVRRLQLANNLADHSVLGYRGLIGNPDLPPSSIVAKIMQRFEVNERKKSMGSIEQTLR